MLLCIPRQGKLMLGRSGYSHRREADIGAFHKTGHKKKTPVAGCAYGGLLNSETTRTYVKARFRDGCCDISSNRQIMLRWGHVFYTPSQATERSRSPVLFGRPLRMGRLYHQIHPPCLCYDLMVRPLRMGVKRFCGVPPHPIPKVTTWRNHASGGLCAINGGTPNCDRDKSLVPPTAGWVTLSAIRGACHPRRPLKEPVP